jgi:hypothetical protein
LILKDLFTEIESNDFSAQLNVVSGLRSFLHATSKAGAVDRLLNAMQEREHCNLVLNRILELSKIQPDPRYENPRDVALAVYLWLLKIKNRDLAEIGAETISRVPQCWWARYISQGILEGKEQFNTMSFTENLKYELQGPGEFYIVTTAPNQSAEEISLAGLVTHLLSFYPIHVLTFLNDPIDMNSNSVWSLAVPFEKVRYTEGDTTEERDVRRMTKTEVSFARD